MMVTVLEPCPDAITAAELTAVSESWKSSASSMTSSDRMLMVMFMEDPAALLLPLGNVSWNGFDKQSKSSLTVP